LLQNPKFDYIPKELSKKIEELSDMMYMTLNNGVYRSGMATSQKAYDEAVTEVFETLEKCEEILSKNRYLAGETFTEADIRLYVTLVRFDPVYHVHFKCSLKRIQDYPNLSNYLRELYQIPAFKETTHIDDIRNHYYQSHRHINPHGIVAVWGGNYEKPHNRSILKAGGVIDKSTKDETRMNKI